MKNRSQTFSYHILTISLFVFLVVTHFCQASSSVVLFDIDTGSLFEITEALTSITKFNQIDGVVALKYMEGTPGDNWLVVIGDNTLQFLDATTLTPLFDLPEEAVRTLFNLSAGKGVFSALTLPNESCDTLLYYDPATKEWFGIDLHSGNYGTFKELELTEPFYTGFGYTSQHDIGLILKDTENIWWYETLPDRDRIWLDFDSLLGDTPSQLTEFSLNISPHSFNFLIAVIEDDPDPTPTPSPTPTPTPTPSEPTAYDVVVAMSLDENLWRIDSETFDVQSNIAATGQAPNCIVQHAEELYVLNSLSNSITVYDPHTLSLKRELSVGAGTSPFSMAFVDDQDFYVTQFNTNTVSRVNAYTGQVITVIDLPDNLPTDEGKTTYPRPSGIYVHNTIAYIACANLDDFYYAGGPGIVVMIDMSTDQVTGWFESGGRNCADITYSPNFPDWLWVVNTGDYSWPDGFSENGTISAFNIHSNELIHVIETNDAPNELIFGPDHAYFASSADGRIGRFDPNSFDLLSPLSLSSGGTEYNMASGLAIGPDNRLWALEFNHNKVWVIDTDQDDMTIQEISVGQGPDALIIVPRNSAKKK